MGAHPSRLRRPLVERRRRQVMPAWVRRADASAARRINARRVHPLVDRGYARLSRFADRGVMWFSLAALLAFFGRVRPALRGVASLATASILANLVGKKVFGGDRPLLKDIPVGRRLHRYPTSSSFPSGHSASAAAFATGVALESPRLGAAVAPLALGVIYSRLHTGAHWLSDVIGGTALGVAVGTAGKLLVPARSRPRRPAAAQPVDLPALPDGEGLFIVINPDSGTSVGRPDPTPVLRRRLPRARLHTLASGEDLVAVVRHAIAGHDRPRVVGICGGDGSVSAVSQPLREAGVPLLLLPGGTFNDFAGSVGVPSIDRAIDAVQAGTGLRVAVAGLSLAGGDPLTVLNEASVGLYPDFVTEREKRQQRLGKWVAAVVAGIVVLRRSEPVTVSVDGRRSRVWSLVVRVDRGGEGDLRLRVLHARSRGGAVAGLALGDVFGWHTRGVLSHQRMLQARTASSLRLVVGSADGSAPPFVHDGEVWLAREHGAGSGGGYRARLEAVPGGLELYAPRER